MIYANKKLIKKQIEIRDIKLDFNKEGCYLISGENGCGKTTLLESIIFDSDISHFKFEAEQEKYVYENEKYNLFSYVSQKNVSSELIVYKYIKKYNKNINRDAIKDYLEKFNFDEDILSKKYEVLSGGEKKLIDIITAFLKNTPYVFLDEPTNHLDNQAINTIIKILEHESKSKKIIIVSHDPRLKININKQYLLQDNKINVIESNNIIDGKFSINIPKNKNENMIKIIFQIANNKSFIIAFLVAVFMLSEALFYSTIYLSDSLGVERGNYSESILVYYTGGGHDLLNEMYENAENITVEKDNYEKYISYSDLPRISTYEGVDAIYIPDVFYTDKLRKYLTDNHTHKEWIFACPNKYINQYCDTYGDEFCLSETEGKLPRDGEEEVAVSKKLLIDNYGYDKSNVSDAIGDKIRINEKEYTIVGFSYYDIAIVSYEKSENYGFYAYNDKTYERYCKQQKAYIKQENGTDALNNILLEVSDVNEKTVLNKLIQRYPSNCYISKQFEKVFYNQQKKLAFMKAMIMNSIVAALYSIVMWFVIRKALYNNLNMIYDIGNYYIDRRKVMRQYIGICYMLYVVTAVVLVTVNTALSKYSYLTNAYILLDTFIILIPTTIALKKGYRNIAY